MFKFIDDQPNTLFLDSAHCEQRVDRVAAGAYAGILSIAGQRFEIWGLCGVRNPEILYLQAISISIEEILAELSDERPRLEVFCRTDGFLAQTRYFEKWLKRGGRNSLGFPPDSYQDIKRCYEMAAIGCLTVTRVEPRTVPSIMPLLHVEANRLAKLALEVGANKKEGVLRSGRDFASAR